MAANKFKAAMRRLKAVATKEVRQLSRDRVTFGMIVGVPLMQIILFGYAINYDVRNLATVVQDDANSSMSREFIAQLKATQVVHVRYTTNSSDELAKLMREGRASMAVVIPQDFERRLQADTRPVVQILVDGSQPQLAVRRRRHRSRCRCSRATAKVRIRAANAWRRGASRSARSTTRRNAPRCRSCRRSSA